MSYGDYNPDEVSEKFQDNLNLDSQGGGGYGGDDYEGATPHHTFVCNCSARRSFAQLVTYEMDVA